MEPTLSDRIRQTIDFLKGRIPQPPSIAIVLGSGLSQVIEGLENQVVFNSADIPFFARSSVEGHKGQVIFGSWKGVGIGVLAGRVHYHEGHDIQEVVFPIHVLHILGAKTLIVTNASGGINAAYMPGDIMLMTDHINLMGVNPLRGANNINPKNPFPDMTNVYTKSLQQVALDVAAKLGISLKQGVFIAASGPSYETKAEIRAFRQWGADAVGMSTVPEVIVASYHKMGVVGLSCIANPAADIHPGGMHHGEVLKMTQQVAPDLMKLILGIVERIGNVQPPAATNS